jgi:hypothetical protein
VAVINTYTPQKPELYTIMDRMIMHRQRIPARIARSFTKVSGMLTGTWKYCIRAHKSIADRGRIQLMYLVVSIPRQQI